MEAKYKLKTVFYSKTLKNIPIECENTINVIPMILQFYKYLAFIFNVKSCALFVNDIIPSSLFATPYTSCGPIISSICAANRNNMHAWENNRMPV